ncbi:unnamed protein product [Rotaria sordida]|uniref:Uncharacterized protein n=1 Tax=Rotaria sordida TaxID=392033 RepID=A0A815ZP92_9BILA|nr:unnamed protein product [Rotaria sordida]CAF1585388.1 unnamed protein product [Rotaria sordida]
MKRSSNGIINSLDDSILERFCSYILPKIHYKIKWLDLEPLCMERILLVADYPNLHGLSLFNIERDTILRLFGDIMSHMPKLNKFVFSIHSNLNVDDLTHLPSNEDIQRTFKGLEDYQIISYIHYFPDDCIGQCHMYSQPYTMNYLYRLTNSFPGGLFKFVHKVSLYDEHPFEHEFFIRIAQSFPLLRTLSIDNESPQKHKQRQQLNKDRRSLPVIKYAHLTLLSLNSAHNDYIEQFLIHTKTCLSNYISLDVYYPSLQKVTNNFTRDTTRINCAKINYIYNIDKWNVSKHFHTYFPYVEKF